MVLPAVTSPDSTPPRGNRPFLSLWDHLVLATVVVLLSAAWALPRMAPPGSWRHLRQAVWVDHPQPLKMQGGDPYLRALMRTISAAESNTSEPYRVLYGGELMPQLARHPNTCIEIVAGPNRGNCTTAAGRYQFLKGTWDEKAARYHPHVGSWRGRGDFSFDPVSQDVVVHNWLQDQSAWGVDISALLRNGELDQVLRLLSGTWTSLGYGIETNSMSAHLPRIYQAVLAEELAPYSAAP